MSRTRKPPKKSPSERLRGVFYQLYIKEKPMVDFEEYYESKMEMLIEHYKKLITKN
jgi:hypothetical protein